MHGGKREGEGEEKVDSGALRATELGGVSLAWCRTDQPTTPMQSCRIAFLLPDLVAGKDLSADGADGRRSGGNACGAKSRHILRRRRQPIFSSSAPICAHLRMDHPILTGTAPGVRKEDSLPNDIIQAAMAQP